MINSLINGYEILLIFIKRMSDTIYEELRSRGLILSEPAEVQLPRIRPPKPTLMGQITSIFSAEQKFKDSTNNIVIVPVLSSTILVGRANTLLFYKYEIEKETEKVIILPPQVENLHYKIKQIHICDNKFLNDRGEVPFLVESDDHLTLFSVDLKEYKIMQHNSLPYSKLYSVRFICEKEFLLLTHNQEIHHMTIQGSHIKFKNKKLPADLVFPNQPNLYLKSCKIVGSIDEEQDSVVALFYLIKNKENQNFQILKVKEYLRNFEGKIQALPADNAIITNQHSTVLPEHFEITAVDSYYCIETKIQILILKKKFDKYLFIDNIQLKVHGNTLKLNPLGIVSSHREDNMELSVIQFGDPKCHSRILDSVEINPELSDGFKMLWPFKNQKETCLMLVFQKANKLIFFNIIKMDPMKKMEEVVARTHKTKISVVQEIAVNLGINKKDFYLTLWSHSKRQISDIYQFLLPCSDITSIKKQIRNTMKRKKIDVPEFVKILQKMTQIIKNELKTKLTQHMLKQYIKNDFLLRKIKLKQKDKKLDHRDLQKVYNSSLIDMFVEIVKNDLYPEEKKLDPLHVMVFQPEKEHLAIGHVFQQFRIMILENYKQFIVDFLGHFNEEGQLVNVMRHYNKLLPFNKPFILNLIIHEPDYMTEVELNQSILKANGQQLWFADMTSIQFNRQMSIERIQRELHEYYPTSKIKEAINTLVNSTYGAQKLRRHGLISCTMSEYKQKLKDIYGVKLYLKVCEYSNECDVFQEQTGSEQLVEIFKEHNQLKDKDYYQVKLYASMHKFMLKNQFCEKREKGFTTEELIAFTPEDLVALFFLENRQRKEFIFEQFRNLYFRLYGNPNEFNAVIDKFIRSENCSRIQLQIFIKQVQTKGTEFQVQNQQLIELLVDGFCKKLEIREDTDTKHFLELMEEIELSKNLGMKVNKIMQIRKCLGILNVFHCQKLTYYEMLDYQEGNKIFKILLEKYFTQEIKRQTVRIEDEEISLDFCRNMLTVLLYLQETIYYDVSERELLLTYGQILIEWKQFTVMKGILYDEEVLQTLGIDKRSYIEELIIKTLENIYIDQEITYDLETKDHIRNILDIYQEENIIRVQQFAKLELVEIFEKWGVVVHPVDIHTVCYEWNVVKSREEFIIDVLEEYISKIDLKTFQEIYKFLELTSDRELKYDSEGKLVLDVDIYDTEYVKYVLIFAQKLLSEGKYNEIIEIFAFVKSMDKTEIDYLLMTQAFLKSTNLLYSDEENLQHGKELIEYFTQYISDDIVLHKMFENRLADIHFQEGQREETILIDPSYCFKNHRVEISLDLLWSIAEAEVNEREEHSKNIQHKESTTIEHINSQKSKPEIKSKIEQIYYAYYFLLIIFRSPDSGLKKINKITYSLETITNLLFKLEAAVEQTSSLWAINILSLFKKFRKGLYLVSLTRVAQLQDKKLETDQTQLEMIKNILKDDKNANRQLLDCLARMETYIAANSSNKATKRTQKEIRFEGFKLKQEANKPRVEVEINEPEIEVVNATINLKNLRDMKFQLSNRSAILLTEKDILEQIYQNANEEKQKARAKNKREHHPLFLTALTALNGPRKEAAQTEIHDRIINEEFDKIRSIYPKEDVMVALKSLYESGEKDFYEMIYIMEEIGLFDQKKLDIGRTCKIHQLDIPIQDIKNLFPFEYFVEKSRLNDKELKDATYETLRPLLQSLIQKKQNQYMNSLAHFIGGILESNVYINKVYIDTMINMAEHYAFTAQTVIRFGILMKKLKDIPEIIYDNVSRILNAAKDQHEMKRYIKNQFLQKLVPEFPGDEDLKKYIQEA